MAGSYGQALSFAMSKMGIGTKALPGEIFPKFTKTDFDALKADYQAQYGYTIHLPQWDDIIHLEPTLLKTQAEISAEKTEALTRILASPAPDWAMKYSTVMTWIDNVQDTMSIVYPMLAILARTAPKVFGKLTPVIGWLGLGYDLLNLANALGRAPLTPMKSKREVCKYKKGNPFSKTARLKQVEKIKNYKPGLSDLLQVAQVMDQFTGAGLNFGGIMGAITDSAFGAYRYVSGDPVKFSFDPPDVETLHLLGSRGMKAAAAISSSGQVFSDMTHFWTYLTASCCSNLTAGWFKDNELTDLIINPTEVMLPADEPTDPNTIAVISSFGLNVQQGVGWPYNGKKFISMGDYIDATCEPCRANFEAYCLRHSKDSYGYMAAVAMDSMIPQTLLAMDPGAKIEIDDTPRMKVFWKMIKAPVLPSQPVTQNKGEAFLSWVDDYFNAYGKEPGLLEIEQKFNMIGIPYQTSYPAAPAPGFEEFFEPGWSGADSF